ncbi:MAG: glutamine-hydrolyzing GMP synthase [Candidatus Thermoplasmatota archaeon]|nr:glutamine-hydrolyzing GMP synthase [Candidatus Thermoplasmatota archaeon]MCL5786483.1 glutamine-hydrolyzing GMP synthase [Candidatus Thermoplasmatota archaeon]
MPQSLQEKVEELKSTISSNLKGKGILACSGGQDSSLLAVLCSVAASDKVLAVFVDTGLLRKGDRKRVESLFTTYQINYRIEDASEVFLSRLSGVYDPEEKRKIIGKTFIDVFEGIAKEYGAKYLIQGTIAPDWIESGGSRRETIKSHHNVGGLPENMNLKLIEPLRDLYKDDVREISQFLGMDTDIQPFPGPGLAVRILGEVTKEKVQLLQDVTEIVESEVISQYTDRPTRPWQFFPILLPVQTTGIHGDKRSYGYTIALRLFDTVDGMSGTFSKPPMAFLEKISTKITNGVPSVNRVVYDITNKPPATIEWE